AAVRSASLSSLNGGSVHFGHGARTCNRCAAEQQVRVRGKIGLAAKPRFTRRRSACSTSTVAPGWGQVEHTWIVPCYLTGMTYPLASIANATHASDARRSQRISAVLRQRHLSWPTIEVLNVVA